MNTTSLYKNISHIFVSIITLFSGIVLIGWLLHLDYLKTFDLSPVTMKVNTSICFVLSGLSWFAIQSRKSNPLIKLFAVSFPLIIFSVSSFTLIQYTFDINLGIDEFFLADDLNPLGTSSPGRNSPVTAFSFSLIAISLLCIFYNKGYQFIQSSAILIFCLAFLCIFGYLYDVSYLQGGLQSLTKMALNTALLFIGISFSLLLTYPDKGIMKKILSKGISGVLLRSFLPVAIFVPLITSWLSLLGVNEQMFSANFGSALFALSTVLVLILVLFRNAKSISKIANENEEIKNSYKNLFELNPAVIAISNYQTGKFLSVNKAFINAFGFTSFKEVIGKTASELNIEPKNKSRKEILNCLDTHQTMVNEQFQIVNKHGQEMYFSTSATLIESNNEKRILTASLDITKLKRVKQEIRMLNSKLEQKVVDRTNALLIQNSQLEDFCNIVSHNLRGPLVNISMLIDMIELNENTAEREMLTKKIKPIINHLNEVFHELVETVQVKQDTEIKLNEVDLRTTLENSLQGFKTQIDLFNAEVEYDFNLAPKVCFPQKYIDSILSNLISNSLKYRSPEREPKIQIETKQTDTKILLTYTDNGLGIDLALNGDKLFKIRKVFHDHPDAKGFGLFMTKTQLESMGGKIWVKSEPNNGCTFYIEFNNKIPCQTN